MAQSLQEQHPDIVIITEKFGHAQHHVNYKIFRTNRLILKPDVVIPEGQNDYGMSLKILEEDNGLQVTEPDSFDDAPESHLESSEENAPALEPERENKALGPQLGLF